MHRVSRSDLLWRKLDAQFTLLTDKSLNPRYVDWSSGQGSSFSAQFSFDATPDEMIFGTGQHQDHIMNQKGQTIDLVHFK